MKTQLLGALVVNRQGSSTAVLYCFVSKITLLRSGKGPQKWGLDNGQGENRTGGEQDRDQTGTNTKTNKRNYILFIMSKLLLKTVFTNLSIIAY